MHKRRKMNERERLVGDTQNIGERKRARSREHIRGHTRECCMTKKVHRREGRMCKQIIFKRYEHEFKMGLGFD